mgnify:CR=1 FL=1
MTGVKTAAGTTPRPDSFRTRTTERVTLHALLCMLEVDRSKDPVVQGCTTNPALQDSRYFLITLLARGEADCDGGVCNAEALVAEKIGSFGPGGNEGGPGAPLTARTSVPLSGTVEIVPNPNGGGVGVPVSVGVLVTVGVIATFVLYARRLFEPLQCLVDIFMAVEGGDAEVTLARRADSDARLL